MQSKRIETLKARFANREADELREELDALKLRYADLESEYAEHRRTSRFLDRAKLHTVKPVAITAKQSSRSESTVVAFLSDVHAGERVDPATVDGANAYNAEIAKARCAAFAQKVAQLTEIEAKSSRISSLVLGLGGDLISGHIHEELRENGMAPLEELRLAKSLITGILNHLLTINGIERIVVPCCVGNHGRDTIKMPSATAWAHSYEAHLYRDLAEQYTGKAEFIINPAYHQYVKVYRWTLRFHHGDAISYNGGILGPAVPLSKKVANWNSQKHADYDYFGHLHSWGPMGTLGICNGSVIGRNAYAVRIGAPAQPPTQTFSVWEKDKGLTQIRPIYLA